MKVDVKMKNHYFHSSVKRTNVFHVAQKKIALDQNRNSLYVRCTVRAEFSFVATERNRQKRRPHQLIEALCESSVFGLLGASEFLSVTEFHMIQFDEVKENNGIGCRIRIRCGV